MNTKSLILGLALAGAATSPALAREVAVSASEGVVITYADSVATGASEQPTSFVALSPATEQKDKRLRVSIYLVNHSGAPLNFGPGQVSAKSGETPLTLVTEAQLAKEQKNREGWQNFGMALAASMNSAAAGTGYSSTSGRVGRTSYSSSTTYYSPYAASVARAENREMMAGLAETQAAARIRIADETLSINTLPDGADIAGTVTFELPKELAKVKAPLPVEVAVEVAGTVHRFTITATKG